MRDEWCFFCKISSLQVKGTLKIPHMGGFRDFKRYFKIDLKWQSYIHYILQSLILIIANQQLNVDNQVLTVHRLLSTWWQTGKKIIFCELWILGIEIYRKNAKITTNFKFWQNRVD